MSSRERETGGSSRHERAGREDAPYDPAPKIFVGGLPFSLTFEEIKTMFEVFGTIAEITVPRTLHDPRKHKGFAFITYDSFRSMDDAISKMNGKDVRGQVLSVARATINRLKQGGPDRAGHGPDRGQRYSGPGQHASGGRDYRDGGSGGGYGRDSYRGSGGSSRYEQQDNGGGRYDDRAAGRSSYSISADGSRHAAVQHNKPPIGYRCRVTGLAPDVDWRLLKDFLRQVGEVTYAQVDAAGGRGIGEYMTLDEVRDAVDKLTGAAINGSIVKLTPLNFDMQTGEKFQPSTGLFDNCRDSRYDDRSSSRYDSRSNTQYDDRPARDSRYTSRDRGYNERYDSSSKDNGRYGSHYDDRGAATATAAAGTGGGGGYSSGRYDAQASRPYTDSGRASRRDYDMQEGGGGYSTRSGGGGGGTYDNGRDDRSADGGGYYQPHRRERERSLDRNYTRPAPSSDHMAAPLARGDGRVGAAAAGYSSRDRERDGAYDVRGAAGGVSGGGGGGSSRYYDDDRGVASRGGGGDGYGAAGYDGVNESAGAGAGGSSRYGGGGSGGHSTAAPGYGTATAAAAAAAPAAMVGGSSRYGGGGAAATAALGGSSQYGGSGGGVVQSPSGLAGGVGLQGLGSGGPVRGHDGVASQSPHAAAAGGASGRPGTYSRPWQ